MREMLLWCDRSAFKKLEIPRNEQRNGGWACLIRNTLLSPQPPSEVPVGRFEAEEGVRGMEAEFEVVDDPDSVAR